MADISDVTAYLAQTAANAVYPNGTSSASVTGDDVRIFEGWPIPDQLDLDLAGKQMSNSTPPTPVARPNGPCANVSVMPIAGASGPATYQILDKTYVIVQPTINLTASVSGTTLTLSGTPTTGEFITIIADYGYVYSAGGASVAAILSALATQAEANYSGVTVTSSSITIPANIDFVVRQGGVGILGKVTHRESQAVAVTVWAPDPTTRTTLAKAIDVAIKANLVVAMPDTSDVKITFLRTNIIDDYQNVTTYRRDLVYEVEYATLETFPGTTVTSVGMTLSGVENDSDTPNSTSIIA